MRVVLLVSAWVVWCLASSWVAQAIYGGGPLTIPIGIAVTAFNIGLYLFIANRMTRPKRQFIQDGDLMVETNDPAVAEAVARAFRTGKMVGFNRHNDGTVTFFDAPLRPQDEGE